MKKQLVLFLLFAGIYTQVHAQTFSYDVDFITYFDNREYQSALQPSQTIFGTRLSPEIGVIFNDSLGGTHKMMANHPQEINTKQPCRNCILNKKKLH
jgi:hypothetical protein